MFEITNYIILLHTIVHKRVKTKRLYLYVVLHAFVLQVASYIQLHATTCRCRK